MSAVSKSSLSRMDGVSVMAAYLWDFAKFSRHFDLPPLLTKFVQPNFVRRSNELPF